MPCVSTRADYRLHKTRGESVVIGLGGNIGSPASTISSALQELVSLAMGEVVASSIFRSEAFGMAEDADDFANAVARFECGLEPIVLLRHLQTLEAKYGRPSDDGPHTDRGTDKTAVCESALYKSTLYQSRVLDLDIIAFGDRLIIEDDLRIPHPLAFERLFVLLPLQEIDPGFRFVDRKESLQQLIDSAPEMTVVPWQAR
ncbi:MAG: 2-amino-4-hydroxy-6-hydroxymethyldihydropteridine diphosphokinase [Gammaproteobacteria bacterium]|nr:2-amino-4-hydroxy-6-hydroxymethyldihydropteridine diphosphokinase [Gammaproteobacteria bacterium]